MRTPQKLADVQRLDWRTLFKAKDDLPEATIKAFDEYFSCFAQPPYKVEGDGRNNIGNMPCLKCDKPLLGGLTSLVFGGGFEWGIAHGEGHCAHCRWPARNYHFIKDAEGNDICTLRNIPLQYHPDFITSKTKAAELAD